MTPDEKLFDQIVTDSLNILRLSASEKQAVLAQLRRMERDLIARLSEGDLAGLSRAKVEKFLRETDKLIGEHYGEVETLLDQPGLSEFVAHKTADALEIALGQDVALPLDYLDTLASNVLIEGAPTADWWKAQADATRMKFKAQVRQGLGASETNQQIISRIVGKNGNPGIMDIVRRDAATLVQSSVQTVANKARLATFQANADVLKGIKQVSTLDGHTTLICVSYSGASWNLDLQPILGNTLPYKNGAPRHWNCRSVEIPITKTFEELGLKGVKEPGASTRASVDGQIAGDTTFEKFLSNKSPAFQNELLGEGRADLWRKGKITLRDLVNNEGNPISLAELNIKYGFKGKSEPGVRLPIHQTALDYVNEAGNKKRIEAVLVYDAESGREIFRKTGTHSEVEFNKRELGGMKDAVILHNHPVAKGRSEENSLSLADFNIAVKTGAKEVIAVTPYGTQFVGSADKEISKYAYEAMYAKARKHYKDFIANGGSNSDAQTLFVHGMNVALRDTGFVKYSVETPSERFVKFIADNQETFDNAVELFKKELKP